MCAMLWVFLRACRPSACCLPSSFGSVPTGCLPLPTSCLSALTCCLHLLSCLPVRRICLPVPKCSRPVPKSCLCACGRSLSNKRDMLFPVCVKAKQTAFLRKLCVCHMSSAALVTCHIVLSQSERERGTREVDGAEAASAFFHWWLDAAKFECTTK